MGEDASEERRLFEPRAGGAHAYVASDLGLLRVDLGPDRIGEFSLVERCQARAVGATDSLVTVGTAETVLLDTGDGFESTGFGPAVAVGVADGSVVAAGPDGTVGRCVDPTGAADWEQLDTVSEPRQLDGRLLAAGDGVYRVGDGLDHIRNAGAHDVTGTGPRAATDEGLFRAEGADWVCEHDGAASVVTSGYAVDDEGLLERADDRWERLATPARTDVVDLEDGACLYAVTADGEFLMSVPGEQATDGQGGWRSRTLGVHGVTGLAVQD